MKTMKNKIFRNIASYIVIIIFIYSCSFVKFNDINDYNGSIVLRIEQDSTGLVNCCNLYIKDSMENYNMIIIQPGFAKILNVGDTL